MAFVNLGQRLCPLSGVERCPLLGGCKCTIVIARSIGGTPFGRCLEVVRFSESTLLEVLLYITILSEVFNDTF